MKNKIQIFQSLDKLRIILFWEILKEKNPFLLDANFKPENNYTDEEQEFVVNTWERLYDEFFEARNDSKGRGLLKESDDEMNLLYKIKILFETRNLLASMYDYVEEMDVEIYETLKIKSFEVIKITESKLKLDPFMSIPNAVKLIDRALASLQNTYTIKSKRNNQEVDKQIKSCYAMVASLENVLERSIVNINEMVASHWIELEKIGIEKIKSQKDSKHGKK